MEPHQLAIAALKEFASPSSHRPARSDQNATITKTATTATTTDSDIETSKNRVMGHTKPNESSSQSQGSGQMSSSDGESQENPSNATLGLQLTSTDNSQSTLNGHDVPTPPTSASDGFSSQSTNPEGQLSQLSQLSQLAAAAANTSSARPNLSIAPPSGIKRTADGQVKPTAFTSPTSPHGSKVRSHSRNTSAVSAASTASSNIGQVNKATPSAKRLTDIVQLSSELRTRLSYAMVKVNNGWQSNSIDEVESLASQAGSPTSSTSTVHGRRNLITSPRTNIATLQGQSSFPINSIVPAPIQDFDLYSRNDPPSRTYESFWRDHSTSNPLPAQRSSHALSHKLSLQPPADIRPTPSTRRSHTPKFSKPPAIPGQGSNSSLNTSMPRTPNGRAEYTETKGIQTPTQKTIQEQDAMEALLFMSSPGNSGNMGHAFPPPARSQMSPQQSPLRTEFNVQPSLNRGAQARRVEFEKAPLSTSTGSSEAGEYQRKTKAGSTRSHAIDRLLDEMVDSSSDEEEVVLNYSSPRRVTAGRV